MVNNNIKKRSGNGGFTMIELIVTITILAVVAAFTIPGLMGFVDDAYAKDCRARMNDVERRYVDEAVNLGVDYPAGYKNFNLVELIMKKMNAAYENGDPIIVDTANIKDTSKAKTNENYAGICPRGGIYKILLTEQSDGSATLVFECNYQGHETVTKVLK